MPLAQEFIDSVANANLKTMSELATQNAITAQQLTTQNAITNQQQLNILGQKSLAKSLESMDTTDITEGLGMAAAQRGDLAKVLAELAGSIASAQQQLKGAQTTPPTT